MANFPRSLVNGNSHGVDDSSAYELLTTTVTSLIDRKLEFGLLQLHLEANWDQITAQCSTTPEDSKCNLDTHRFSTLYTPAMASWEYLLRADIELERSGLSELPSATLEEIESLVTEKIGIELIVDNGRLTQLATSSYRYEISTTTDLGFGETIYTVRWAEDKVITSVSLANVGSAGIESLQSSINTKKDSTNINNSILVTTYENGNRLEQQLNLHQPLDPSELQIEAQRTEIVGTDRNDFYSIGNASNAGGYLKSQHVSEDESDNISSQFLRESFTSDANIEAQSICRMSVSEAQCDLENKWEILTPRDPIISQFFLSPTEMTELEYRLTPFRLQIEGVSDKMDVLVLIRRENLSISVSSEGVVISLPGLGTFDFTTNEVTPDRSWNTLDGDTEPFTEYVDSVLCRSNKTFIDNQIDYRSFCAGSADEIENALVIGESFVGGELVIEWQANASITVIDD